MQGTAVVLLIVLLGHPLAAVCACWQNQAESASPSSGCHEDMAPGASIQSSARDCCLVVPAAPAPSTALVQKAGALPLLLPSLQPTALEAVPSASESSESPPRGLGSTQALLGVFLI